MEISWYYMDINSYLPKNLNWFMNLRPSKKDQEHPGAAQWRNGSTEVIQELRKTPEKMVI